MAKNNEIQVVNVYKNSDEEKRNDELKAIVLEILKRRLKEGSRYERQKY
ncbi:hypothetical protein MUJ63_06010 [Lachnospiraceae bacterium NSJ-143]|nr:hypothetical protein [Lachnospiraceae bacterium NSJ-143]